MEILDRLLSFVSAMPSTAIQGLIWGIMAIGVYLTYKILDIADLTVDGSIVTGMAVCAVMVSKMGLPVWLGLLCGMLSGMVAGFATGIFHTVFGIPAILSGILTQLMLWSVNLKIMGGTSNVGYPFGMEFFVSTRNIGMTIVYLILIVLAIVGLFYWFFGTELGSSIRATGCNLNMSRAQGINTDRNKVLGLIISNGVVALSGAILSLFLGFSDANAGRGAIVIGLAAVIIGEALFSKLTKSNFALKLLSVVAGGVIYYIVYQTVIYLGLDSTYLKLLSAVVVAIFLGVPYWRKKYLGKTVKKGGKKHA